MALCIVKDGLVDRNAVMCWDLDGGHRIVYCIALT